MFLNVRVRWQQKTSWPHGAGGEGETREGCSPLRKEEARRGENPGEHGPAMVRAGGADVKRGG